MYVKKRACMNMLDSSVYTEEKRTHVQFERKSRSLAVFKKLTQICLLFLEKFRKEEDLPSLNAK